MMRNLWLLMRMYLKNVLILIYTQGASMQEHGCAFWRERRECMCYDYKGKL